MAYALSLHTDCDAIGCNKAATFTVFRNFYSPPQDRHGVYCAKHTNQRIKMLNSLEMKTS